MPECTIIQTGIRRFAVREGETLLGYVTKTLLGWMVENAACNYRVPHRYPSMEMAADILVGKVNLRRCDRWEPRRA